MYDNGYRACIITINSMRVTCDGFFAVYNKFKEPSKVKELFSLKGSMNVE